MLAIWALRARALVSLCELVMSDAVLAMDTIARESVVPWRLVVSNTETRLREDAVGCRASQLITAAAGQGALRNVLSEWRLTLDAQAWA